MTNINSLSHRVEKIYLRLSKLYEIASASASLSVELLPTALLELGIVSEALQLAMKELAQQCEKLNLIQKKREIEQQRYKNLFEFTSDGYLVTDRALVIREVNPMAAHLLNIQESLLLHTPLITLVAEEDRSLFQAKLSQVSQHNRVNFCVRLLRRQGGCFNSVLTVNIIHDHNAESLMLQWLLRDATNCYRAAPALEATEDYDPYKDRFLHVYGKGKNISLESDKLWLVSQGMVKLTTLSDRGDEILIGLAYSSMIFGSSLTALPIYQAVALSKVQLVAIPLAEISQSPQLAQVLLPLMGQRLRQTEKFLSIYGQIHVEDRLTHLLSLLKQEIGQPVEEGIRLRVRLTHQDFASACCTTRVTITRLLGRLQQDGKITLDANNHLIMKSDDS